MTSQTQQKWDRIYTEQEIGSLKPARVLTSNLHLLPHSGRALDLACGLGSNAIAMAQRGLQVDAWDISPQVIGKLEDFARRRQLSIHGQACDLLHTELPRERYDVILISHYLERQLSRSIVDALKPGGLLLFQTFTREVTSDYSGPGNPDFRLGQGELLEIFRDLRLLVYREEALFGDLDQGLRNEALMVAAKP